MILGNRGMVNTIRLMVALIVFLIIHVFVIMPALQQFFLDTEPFLSPGSGGIGGVLGPIRQALFLAMPLLLLGGVVVLGFVIATGIRGTSLQ